MVGVKKEKSVRKTTKLEVRKKKKRSKTLFKELTERYSDKFDIPKLRLWSRMVASNIHTSMDEPPKIPIFGTTPKKIDESLPI